MVDAVGGALDLSALQLPSSNSSSKKELGQTDFLHLMLTQLKNQDPFKPLDSSEFLGQLAQFGTVSGLAQLQTSFDGLASSLTSDQALQASGLVGRSALVPGAEALLANGKLSGAVDLPSGTDAVALRIVDSSGLGVRTLELGPQPQGLARFEWDGTTDTGETAPHGRYSLVAQYLDNGKAVAADTLVSAPIDSVVIGGNGLSITLHGLGEVPFSAVREVGNP